MIIHILLISHVTSDDIFLLTSLEYKTLNEGGHCEGVAALCLLWQLPGILRPVEVLGSLLFKALLEEPKCS